MGATMNECCDCGADISVGRSRCVPCLAHFRELPRGGTSCLEVLASRVEPEPDQATKFDDDKPRVDLFPPEALLGISEILGIGAGKYGDRNWEQGMDWGRAYAANMRHLLAWWGGQDNDPETGKSHLWHAGCNNAFLIAYAARGIGTDTRNK